MAQTYLDIILLDNAFEPKEVLSHLEKFTYSEFQQMQQEWLVSGHLLIFVSGNFSMDTAIKIADESV